MSTPAPTPEIYEFASFRLDVAERVLENTATGERISLPDKAFDTLCVLVKNAGRLVSKEDLLNRVWAESFVEENNLNKSIHAVRRSLGEKNGDQKFVETVKKYGFRFVAPVRVVEPMVTPSEKIIPPAFQSMVREFPWAVPHTESNRSNGALATASVPADTEAYGPEEPSAEQNRKPHLFPVSPRPAPFQRSSRYRVLAAVAAVAGVLVIGVLAYIYSRPTSSTAGAEFPKLAVLAPKPVDADARDRGLEFAVAHSLILKLSDSKAFDVMHLSAVRRYVELDDDPVSVGRELGADYVVSSNYQISGGRIRVTSQLLNIDTGGTEQTFKSEASAQDLFAMQDAIANEIGNDLLERFGKPRNTYAATRGTNNEAAANLYYEAFYLVDKNTQEDSARAVELLGEVVALDPNYAQAWALRAQAYCQFAHNGGGSPQQIFTIAEPMLDKALQLGGDSVTALMVKGVIARDYHWQFDDAYRDLRRSVELDPNNAHAHRLLSGLYFRQRRFAEALAQQRLAVTAHPTSVGDRWFLGWYLLHNGQRDEGVAQLKRVIELDPSWRRPAYDALWQQYHREGDYANAYESFIKLKEQYATKPEHMAALKTAHAKGGWPAVIRAEVEQMKLTDPKGEFSGAKNYIANMAALAGDRDTAFEYLEEAIRYRLIGVSFLNVEWRLDPLRDEPRFQDLSRRAGITAGV